MSTASMSLRQFVANGILRTDKGARLSHAPLVERLIDAFESGAKTIVLTTPRRAGKSTAIAQLVGYFLLCRPLSFSLVCASSCDQAADILHQKLRLPLSLAPSMSRLGLTLARDRLTCPRVRSSVSVVASSELTSPGRTVDLLVFEEPRGISEDAHEILRPSAANGVTLYAGTPGRSGSWWWRVVNDPEPGAVVIRVADPTETNPSLDAEFIAKEKARLTKRGAWGQLLFEREWEGKWVDLAENPLLKPADIERAQVDSVEPYDSALDVCFAAADLSLSKDLTSIVVVARRGDAYRVVHADVLDPQRYGSSLPMDLIEQRLEAAWKQFRPRKFIVDQYQAVSISQRLLSRGVRVEAEAVTASGNMLSFEALSELLADGRLQWARSLPCAERLRAELANLEVQETTAGWKVVDGAARLHRDVSWTVARACLEASRTNTIFQVLDADGYDMCAPGYSTPRPVAEKPIESLDERSTRIKSELKRRQCGMLSRLW